MTPSAGLAAAVQVSLGRLRLDAALEAAAGTTVAVVGPNGAGKSTLVRALAGLQPLDGGRLVLDGQVLDDPAAGVWVPPERRQVGLVTQEPLLFPHLSVADNVAFGLRHRGRSRADARREAEAWLERLGVGELAATRPGQLSGGEAQRVAVARALAVAPRLLLLDEPMSALDATTRPAMRGQLRRHLGGHDGVRVLVTHDPVDAAALADHLIVVEGGKVTQAGSLAELSRRPRSRYVADLVGVNLFRGESSPSGIRLPGGAVLVAAEAPSGPVLAVVHPRAVVLHRRPPEGTARNVWAGRIAGVEHAGDRVRVSVAGPVAVVAEITPVAAADLGLVEGVEVWASVKASEVSVAPA